MAEVSDSPVGLIPDIVNVIASFSKPLLKKRQKAPSISNTTISFQSPEGFTISGKVRSIS